MTAKAMTSLRIVAVSSVQKELQTNVSSPDIMGHHHKHRLRDRNGRVQSSSASFRRFRRQCRNAKAQETTWDIATRQRDADQNTADLQRRYGLSGGGNYRYPNILTKVDIRVRFQGGDGDKLATDNIVVLI